MDVIEAAGGFSDSAYRTSVKITRLTDREKQVLDVPSSQFNSFEVQGGDSLTAGKLLNRYANRVSIEGAVMRPGEFSLSDGMTLKQLIQHADGLREDAFLNRGIITRLRNDLTTEIVSFNVEDIVNGTQPDILLKREDVITISAITDLRNKYTFTIQGEVRKPGVYEFKDSTTIRDLIFQAGGFTEAATGKRIEVARRVTNADPASTSTEIAKIIQADAEKDLDVQASDFILSPFDVIIVRNNPGYFTQKTVYVQGEVMYPGPYVINSIDEKLSSIVQRAGGFKFTADPSAASLKRVNRIDAQAEIKTKRVQKLATTSESIRDTALIDSLAQEAVKPYDLIGINLNEVMKEPGITNDLILEDGDLLFVPKKNQAVKVRGEVLFPTQFAFQANKNMKYYINKAGGYAGTAVKRKSFVLGANGSARKVHTFLIFKTYPEIHSGDEIYVPAKLDNGRRLSTAEAIGITSAIASLAGVVIAILQITK